MQFISNLKNRLRSGLQSGLIKNKKGQGATEYILLLVVIVGLVMMFGPRIKEKMSNKMGDLESGMDEIQTK